MIDAPNSSEGSAFGRMFNILAAPSEVFTEIKEKPVNHSNWVIPALLALFLGIAGLFTLYSQDWAVHEITKAQDKAMDMQVAKGKMTRAQADQAVTMIKKYMPLFLKVGGSISIALYSFGVPFFWGFIIWLVGVKILKGDFEFMKAVEAAGLASIIYTLTGLVGILVAFAMGKITTISLALFVKDFDFTSRLHYTLAAFNPFYLWFAAVAASAAAILAGASWGRAAIWILGAWLLWRAFVIGIGFGQFAM